jgi:hypothetical protein
VANNNNNNNNNNKGPQGRFVLPERADQRVAGSDGLANPHGDGVRHQPGRGSWPDGNGAGINWDDSEGYGERREWESVQSGRSQRAGSAVADADKCRPGSQRGYDGEVRGVSEAQRESEHGAVVSRRSSGAINVANGEVERRPHRDGGPVQGVDEREWPAQQSERCGSDAGFEWVLGADGKARVVKSGIRLLAHGVPARVAKLRALGNAIDLRPATAFIQAVNESLSQ